MDKKRLVEKVHHNLPKKFYKKDVAEIIDMAISVIKHEVSQDNSVSLLGFGTFKKLRRKAREGVNPSTGERMQIEATNVPKFVPGKHFKELLNATVK